VEALDVLEAHATLPVEFREGQRCLTPVSGVHHCDCAVEGLEEHGPLVGEVLAVLLVCVSEHYVAADCSRVADGPTRRPAASLSDHGIRVRCGPRRLLGQGLEEVDCVTERCQGADAHATPVGF